MSWTRRRFLSATTSTGVGAALSFLLGRRWSKAAGGAPVSNSAGTDAYPQKLHIRYENGHEYMAFSTAAPYHAYMTKTGPADAVTWMQIDLGGRRSVTLIKLYPALANGWGFRTDRFPKRFKLQLSDDPTFAAATTIADHTAADFDAGLLRIWPFPANGSGRYVRLTVTKWADDRVLLAKIGVFDGDRDIAVGRPVTVDPVYGNSDGEAKAAQLTRPHRPMGEGIVTNEPANVTSLATWRPPTQLVKVPRTGVELADGVFAGVMANNVRYLLNTDTLDHHLRPFRERAGLPVTADPKPQVPKWETYLPDSSAARFLMGAANTLRWTEHAELQKRMDELVDGIEACQRADGYILAYAPETVYDCERGAYDRSWLTHGLIEAGLAGNVKAFDLLRGMYDWFNGWSELPRLLRGAGQGGQGLVANTRLYTATPVGRPEDIQIVQRYFQENFWLDQLAARNPDAIWLFPYDRPHCYLLTNLEAYFDLYLATGEPRYLHAVQGGWDLFHDHWEHVGGTIAITEFDPYPPDSFRLHASTGELCGSVFWVRFNQRFHLLAPDEEKYVNEIEKTIYNVGLANQVGDTSIIYHARLMEVKEGGHASNTCCEGQGTRLYGSLPEYIYSLAPDGVYINLFEPSTLHWEQAGTKQQVQMETRFPFDPHVTLRWTGDAAVSCKLRVRVPGWADRPVAISVNGTVTVTGTPGSYVMLERTWTTGDTVTLTLPMSFRITRYRGHEYGGKAMYALEYGPILMASIGAKTAQLPLASGQKAEEFLSQLHPRSNAPLHFISASGNLEYAPYWQIKVGTPFACFADAGRKLAVGPPNDG